MSAGARRRRRSEAAFPWLQRIGWRAIASLCLLWWVLWPNSAGARPPLRIDAVEVSIDVDRGGSPTADGDRVGRRGARVRGVVEYRLSRPSEAGERLVLLDFTRFMAEEPDHLDAMTLSTYLEGPFDAGRLRITGSWGTAAISRSGSRGDVVVDLSVGTTTFTLRYEVDVPHRYWPFGCVKRRCSLSGAIAPLPSVPARGGSWLPPGRVVAPARWTVTRAAFSVPGDVVASGRAGLDDGPRERLRPEEIVVVGGRGELTHYPSIVWGPRWHRLAITHHGVEIEVLHPFFRPGGQVPHETRLQLYRDVPGQVARTAQELVEVLEATGAEPPLGTKLVVVQGPLRSTVAEPHPGLVLLSDQALELLPADRFLKFHQEAIARAVLDVFLGDMWRGRHDPSTDLWLPDSMAFPLMQLWRAARAFRDEYAADILRNFTFVPAVDRFLYTQQASFSQTYFRGVEDDPPLRNHPLWFSHRLPTGRRIHEKLSDTLAPAQLEAYYREIIAQPAADPRTAAERAYGRTLGWFFDQWLGPYPSVDYLIADVRSERVGERWRHEIEIVKHAERPVVEPVQLLAVERGGKQHFLVWNGELDPPNAELRDEPIAGRHVFRLETDRDLHHVWLDPRQRLVQTPQSPKLNVDPRFNDRVPPSFRFLYTGAGFSIAASEFLSANTAAARFNAFTGFISFEGSLRRDLRSTGHVIVARDRETHVSVGAGANFFFGPKVNPQRRRARVRFFPAVAWLNDRSLDPRGGVRISQSVSLIDDTRRFSWWPERGHRLAISLTPRQTIRVDEGPNDHRFDLLADAEWVHLWPVAHDHVIATMLRAEMVVPLRGGPEFRSLTRLGGIGGLSAYTADEVFGRGLATAQVEYRHVYVNDLRINVAHLAFVRSLGGVLFSGVASTSPCDGYKGWFGKESWYGQVGYGFMAYLSVFGVTPQLLRVDVSVPLVRRRGIQCLGETLPDYLGEVQGIEGNVGDLLPPVSVNVLVNHAF